MVNQIEVDAIADHEKDMEERLPEIQQLRDLALKRIKDSKDLKKKLVTGALALATGAAAYYLS